ncbi:CapA family protein [Pullulanibacillus sp. KACC 23026]|uniref:CapA family protein n=1 Tax=Pullulanibacillus sp. KACC 23026 TaxID=3028315 RepID=UPI0023B09051|nr:CapA family protein [Pullulanibacillus sp. KACC 23026]WEG12927.1 CapA family protein [Pullulanibacillus sp. KACC 23026]
MSLVALSLLACAGQNQPKSNLSSHSKNTEKTKSSNPSPSKGSQAKKDEPPKTVKTEATLSAVGDVLIHTPVYKDAQTGKNTYDFKPMFTKVKPYLEDSDITFANSESIIGGEQLGLSSYPAFNSPFEVGDALKSVGVDVVSMANNHALDKGEQGILNATSHWKDLGVEYVGANRNESDAQRIRIIEKNGIKFAFLAYTFGTNGIQVPNGKDYLVNYIDKTKMQKDLEKAKAVADVVVVSLHFGVEYQPMPNDDQKDIAQFAVDHGADIILGSHPHVLQPVQWLTGKDGHKAFVIYSLGNFLAGQETPNTQIGGILKLTVEKTQTGDQSSIQVTDPEFLPTYITYKNWKNFKVVPMDQLTSSDAPNPKQIYKETKDRMTHWVKDLKFIKTK